MSPSAISTQESAVSLLPPTPYPLLPALTAFDAAISAHASLEIDDDYVDEGPLNTGAYRDTPLQRHKLKVINHDRRVAYGVSLQTIMDHPAETILMALETGIFNPLYGVTRIVGYYSRIQNWNKSKLGELADRHRGNYSVEGLGARGQGLGARD